ncbi:MAG: hypothetical protein K9M45_03790 [Kiritimatiellales bacterium]|nr:hypothetical protein [Kiritimatiellales bacterium]
MIKPLHILTPLFAAALYGCTPEKAQIIPADQLTVEHSISTNSIHIGDPVELTVTAYYPTNATVTLPPLEKGKDIVVQNRDWHDEPREDGLMQTEFSFKLTSFRVGDHLVSTNPISCTLDDGTVLTTDFPDILLRVESALTGVETNSTEIADIKPPVKLPAKFPRWPWVILLVALIAFLTGLIISKVWKKRPLEKPAPPPPPAHIIALKALEALKNRRWLEEDQCDPFYTELSLILRGYLDGRFGLNAPDSTTEEIVREMYHANLLPVRQQNLLKEFLRQADMVKFAKDHPDKTAMQGAFDTTKHFVEETKNDPANQSDPTDRD